MRNQVLIYTTAVLWAAGMSGAVFFSDPSHSFAKEVPEIGTSTPVDEPAPRPEKNATDPAPAVKSSGNDDLAGMSLESLTGLNVVVTSSAKKAESLRDATSAIFVITQDDIRQSGARHLADLFRIVPGILVSRVDASQWTITARGFNSLFNNKMLVLVDGRSAYQTTFGGVNWNELDLPLEDIDRIEVIRGPGGVLWGSNAVNGIVNIITKDSKITQGFYATSLAGGNGNQLGALRWGGKIGDDIFYRVYAKTEDQGAFQEGIDGTDAQDHWTAQQAGFRADWHGDRDVITLQGDYQAGNSFLPGIDFNAATLQASPGAGDTVDRDGHLLAHWVHTFPDSSEAELKAYYDMVRMQVPDGQDTALDTMAVEFQHRFLSNNWNEVTWGGDFRNVSDNYNTPFSSYYFPEQASLDTYGGFLQDKLTLSQNQLYLTAGVKLENNPYTGDEWQPSGRLLFTPDPTNSFWAAVSRTVRVPSRSEESVAFFQQGSVAPGPTTLYAALVGNPNLLPEDVVAYEMGFRTNLTPKASLDLAGFYDRYYRVITANFTQFTYPNFPPTPIGGYYGAESQAINADGGAIYGVELGVNLGIFDTLRASLAYTYNGYDQVLDSVSNIFNGTPPPHNIADGRLAWAPTDNLQLNTSLYWVDSTPINDPTGRFNGMLPPYDVWDLGMTWKPSPQWEISIWGQDLEGVHTEASSFLNGSRPAPAAYGQLTARY